MDTADSVRAYESCANAPRLYQGEILSNVIQRGVKWTGRSEEGDDFGLVEVVHPYAVIVTQDCDLEQDATARAKPEPPPNALLSEVLLVVASEFEQAKGRMPGSDVRRRAKQNQDERYHFLTRMPAADDAKGTSIPPLVLDFKRLFTYPADELLGAIDRKETSCRGRLVMPYAEHLSSRFGHFMQRVGLPLDHHRFPE